jgi:hypothetical protein
MKRYASAGNRDQISVLPICLDDMISEDNAVRAIDVIVESMDIPSLGFKYSETAETGRKPYNPIMHQIPPHNKRSKSEGYFSEIGIFLIPRFENSAS